MADDQRDRRSDGAVAVVRRAPFSDNPRVGARGQRTQQRILDAALRAFGEDGYHGCSIDRITKLARCSRVSFYQYFASKEDVFGHLAGQVARQLSASTETLDPLTPAPSGWTALRAWVTRYAEIHARYEPVFNALANDDALAAVAARTGEETIARIHSRVATTTLPPRQLDPVIRLLLECLNHTLDVAGILRSVEPVAYPSERVEGAVTDVLHRTLFGLHTDVNVHPPDGLLPPALRFDPAMLELLQGDAALEPSASGNRAFEAVLASGRDVFVTRGYHNTRVDDLAAAAGVSHGAFYRYFRNKDELARILTARAMRAIGATVLEIPDLFAHDGSAERGALRRWLRRYNAAHATEAAMLRVWVDAALQDPALRAESAPPLDWGRRRMARYLQPRGFGDVDVEAVVMVALFGVFGARQRPAAEVEAAAHIIERGLLGR
ncbi:MAG TPA: TetR/AcrR family transcriptional regulator [Acidimicrobiia bacterium]|nr:TetR/AcrR family transcriptional regulator [Acidimicrobiia bacterium]